MHCAEVPREDRGDAKTRSQLLAVLPLESFPDPTSPIQDEPCGHRALFLFLPSSRRGSVQVAYCRRQDARCSRQEKPIRPAEEKPLPPPPRQRSRGERRSPWSGQPAAASMVSGQTTKRGRQRVLE
ncbi:unnamed protein product [Prorocentrum cordatum]|uniref:Uncharacterized protein n=1 Tax=Prorocentrum cordatum TaxID=2364126 RepID=A0ABN9SVN2_9DINO|nr:unnamed protein product [Polarella glacialis]